MGDGGSRTGIKGFYGEEGDPGSHSLFAINRNTDLGVVCL
jgi:hypothetical protein